MTQLELEQRAANGEEIPKNTTFSQKMLFCQLRALYFTVKSNFVSKEQGKLEKQQFLKEFENCQQWENIFKDEVRIRTEINKLTAPEGNLQDKTKEELLVMVQKIIMLHDGKIQTAEEGIECVQEETKK